MEGTAVHLATERIKAKAIQLVAHLFKAPPEALVFENGGVHVVGNAQQGMDLQQIAFVLWLAWDIPEGMDPGLEASAYFDPKQFNYPYGTPLRSSRSMRRRVRSTSSATWRSTISGSW